MHYTNVHTHSEYSNLRLLDSINGITDLINGAVEAGYNGIGITDHESLSGHVKAIRHVKEQKQKEKIPKDFKLILGNEIYLIDDLDNYKDNYDSKTMRYYHFLLLAKNKEGHKLLREASSQAWSNAFSQKGMDRVPITYSQLEEIVKKSPGNLIASTACIGSFFGQKVLQHAVDEDNQKIKEEIHNFILWCLNLFGQENFFIEIQPSEESQEQILYNIHAAKIASAYEIPLIITTDAHYLNKSERPIHKAYLNSKQGDREVDDFYSSTFLMPTSEIIRYLMEYNGFSEKSANECIINTMRIYNACEEYDLKDEPQVPLFTLPEFELNHLFINYYDEFEYIKKFAYSKNEQDRYLLYQIEEGYKEKSQKKEFTKDIHIKRIDMELEEVWKISDVIHDRVSAYYNTAKRIIDIMWEDGDSIVGPARGSVTGYFICYLTDIVQMDAVDWDLPHWRHLTAERPEMPDIDIDTQATKRIIILEAVKDFFGEDSVINICTFGTESSKSAILTACRGYRDENFKDGIDVDTALYMASLVPVERGFNWSINDCLQGNEEKQRRPVKDLVTEIDRYPGLKEIILKIEGLVNKRSVHASGVYIYNGSYINYNAIMRAPNGQIITQFDMGDSDYLGGMKFDFLTIQALDKIRLTLDYMLEDKVIEDQMTLKANYNKYLHPDVLDYQTPEMWKMIGNNDIIDLFQFDTEVGLAAAKLVKPTNLLELAVANSLMRLMSSEASKQPLEEYKIFKEDINLWYEEMRLYGLKDNEVRVLEKHLKSIYGVADTQEVVMELSMDPKISNFSIPEANKLRKAIGKKSEKVMLESKKEFFEKGKAAGTSDTLLNYVWNVQIKRQLGYSFSKNHTMPYSLIALQQMNLAFHYPSVYWNTACLSVNSGSADEEQEKQQTTDYGKIASAIGNIMNRGVEIALPHVNKSKFGFVPDAPNNRILFGLKGINKVGNDLCIEIIKNRPYKSLKDFLNKVKISKDKVINLIKAGAFDEIEGKDKVEIMKEYIKSICGEKKRLTLQNFQMLSRYGLIPEELHFHERVFFFNKYLKKFKEGNNFELDSIALDFYQQNFDNDLLIVKDKKYYINQKQWDKIYQKKMDDVRKYIKETPELLTELNYKLFIEEWEKYASGNISHWEMDSVSFYYHEHELSKVNLEKYSIDDFNSLPENPIVMDEYEAYGRIIKIYKLHRIAGTVLDRNKYRHTVTLLTTSGVVHVKLYRDQFSYFDKQISETGEDGKKKIVEKSWFKRGNKLLLTGIRRGDIFQPKVYKNSVFKHAIYLITDIDEETGDISAEAYRADNPKEEGL